MQSVLLQRSLLAIAVLGFFIGITPAQADFKPTIKYAQVGDVKLAYYTRGKGTPLVMINGYQSPMAFWDPILIKELAKRHQLIVFDNRGVGFSTDSKDNQTTMPQMADDAAGLIKALGFKKANILGWSMGARIAQQVVIRHPDLIDKVVLVSANPGGTAAIPADKDVEEKLNDPKVPPMEKLGLVFPPDAGGAAAAKTVFGRLEMAAKKGWAPKDFNTSKETMERQNRARTTLWSADTSNFADLKKVKNPVLITAGRQDIIDKPANAAVIANQIPFSWVAYFEGGHAFLFQHPKKFAATVDAFLQ